MGRRVGGFGWEDIYQGVSRALQLIMTTQIWCCSVSLIRTSPLWGKEKVFKGHNILSPQKKHHCPFMYDDARLLHKWHALRNVGWIKLNWGHFCLWDDWKKFPNYPKLTLGALFVCFFVFLDSAYTKNSVDLFRTLVLYRTFYTWCWLPSLIKSQLEFIDEKVFIKVTCYISE